MRVKLIDYKIEHLDMIELPEGQELANRADYVAAAHLEHVYICSAEITIAGERKIIAIGGALTLWPGLAEVFSIRSKYVEKYPIAYYKFVRVFIDNAFETLKLHRLQCHITDGEEWGPRWMEKLGFVNEGFMKQYTTDRCDATRYAQVRG